MSANLRAGAAAAGRFARAAQASRTAAQALAASDASLRTTQSRLRWPDLEDDAINTSDESLPSLRSRLEADALTALGGRWVTAPLPTPPTRPSPRSSVSSVASRLVQDVYCALEPGTPRYLASALASETAPGQCRLVISAAPPYRVLSASASPDFLGMRQGDVEGRPALAVLLSGQGAESEGVDGLLESLHRHCRGCADVHCLGANGSGSFPAKVTVSPLMDGSGKVSHMLCVVRPLDEEDA